MWNLKQLALASITSVLGKSFTGMMLDRKNESCLVYLFFIIPCFSNMWGKGRSQD